MKASSNTTAIAAAAFALLLGISASSFAGPGPQYWNKSTSPASSKTPSKVACAGCKDTTTAATTDRGPAGGGGVRSAAASTQHECTRCTFAAEKTSPAAPVMKHAAACAQMSCCSRPVK